MEEEEEVEDEEQLDYRTMLLNSIPDQTFLASLRGSEGAVLREGSPEEILSCICKTKRKIEHALDRDDVDLAIKHAKFFGAATERLRMHPKIERGQRVELELLPNFQQAGKEANERKGWKRRDTVRRLYALLCAHDPQLRRNMSDAQRAITAHIASCGRCGNCSSLMKKKGRTPVGHHTIYKYIRDLRRDRVI